ncbi:response regulator [Marinomonas spartinae]|uniref:response regulator n=1 Tax=Marinomonas spartinae TaxID=1792290 RepID=UPI0018F1174F|nr:response regulator [Marinomonas spartinae]MBJ7554693.1 response regulator [Marinomonas spartinae]
MDSSDFASKKALLIEDMAEARIMQKKMLSDFGFRHIEIAMKAETAMELLKTQSFDVILSDYNLGNGKDGQQLLEEVRHSNLIPNTATYLMVTAETSIEMVMGAIEFQPDGYITKPFSQAVLQRRLSKLLEMKNRLYKVNRALDQKDYDKAMEEAKQVMEQHPSLEGKCQRVIGDCLIEKEQYEQALALFSNILKDRKMPWALFGEAKACFYMGMLDKSENKFRQLMLDNRFFVSAYDWLAKIKTAQKKYHEAQSILIEALQRSPKNLLRQIHLGELSFTIGDYLTAESAFRRAVFLARHSCYNTSDVYLRHIESIIKLAESTPLQSRQKEQFNITLKKIHRYFFEESDTRAKTYSYQLELALLEKDLITAKGFLKLWQQEAESGEATAPTDQQLTHYHAAFGEKNEENGH